MTSVDAHVQTQFARPASREAAPSPASGWARLRRRRQSWPVAETPGRRPGTTLRVCRHFLVHADPCMSHATRTAIPGVTGRVCPCQLLSSVPATSLKCGGQRWAEKPSKADWLPVVGRQGNEAATAGPGRESGEEGVRSPIDDLVVEKQSAYGTPAGPCQRTCAEGAVCVWVLRGLSNPCYALEVQRGEHDEQRTGGT